ncbi:hypothetical protein KEM56_006617 [Ascosphaera pollenicola]|nr:hypothetical protein KEM56_006617 [Ascosphaera pollenicola]
MSLVEYKPLLSLSRYGTMHFKQEDNPSKEYDTKAQVKKEVGFIKQTFGFIGAPKDAVYLGLAGVLPYLATSAVTATLSYQTRLAIEQGHTSMFTPETVHDILDVLEPIQIGYGAVILSFLGAIHWGFEWAKLGGRAGMVRYLPGILAPAVAWPTLYLPFESALLTQFGAFTIMYFFDASASARGTAPGWYANYRWVLTFIIGLSVFVTIWSREMLVLHGYRSSSEKRGEEMKKTAREVVSGDGGVKAAVKAVSDKSPAAAHYKESNADRMRHNEGQSKA